MWRELIEGLTADEQPIGDLEPGPEFFQGATPDQLGVVERELGFRLPEPLTELLAETNGVLVDFGQHLIWDTGELVRYNRPPWVESDTSADDDQLPRLLFFGDAGVDGIRFGFRVTTDNSVVEDIYAWYPILNVRVQKASSLQGYVEAWLSGSMTV